MSEYLSPQSDHLDLRGLKLAVQSLQDSISVVGDADWFDAQTEKIQNTLLAGVIQNFEFVYEISIKMIRRRLELDAASPVEVDEASFRDLLRSAAEKGLIINVEAWFNYRKMRNITAHTYDHEKAEQVYAHTLDFVNDAMLLLKKLEERNARADT
jgi:nucleotidyltransferase substrate binding protein (TIGR01987 family)